MVNHQYSIPEQQGSEPEQQPHETPLREALLIADSVRYTPETQPEAYRFLNDAANRIDSYIDAALENDRNRKRSIRESLPWIPRKELTENDIIDITSELVYGEGTGMRFWKGNKQEHQPGLRNGANEEVAHWYFQQQTWLTNSKPSSIVLHFENRPTNIVKWFKSIPYNPTMGELENLCKTVERYEEKVREKLDPLATTIHDLEEEIIEEEKIIFRDTQEAAFSRQAVDRMVSEYRTKKANEHQGSSFGPAAVQNVTSLDAYHAAQQTDENYPKAA